MADEYLLQEMPVAPVFQSWWSLHADCTHVTLLRMEMMSVLPNRKASSVPGALSSISTGRDKLQSVGHLCLCAAVLKTVHCRSCSIRKKEKTSFFLSPGCSSAIEVDVDGSPGSHDLSLLHLCLEEKVLYRAAIK